MIEFYKIQGSGNDFILIDNRENALKDVGRVDEFVKNVCRQHVSVGADGLILIESSHRAHFRWRFFNADGSEVEMCGNGGRCAARFALIRGIAPERMSFETRAGIIDAEVSGQSVKLRLPDPKDLRRAYTIDLDGNLLLDESPKRLRFAMHAVFGVDQAWQKFRVRLNLKPNAWEIEADAEAELLVLRTGEPGSEWEQAVAFADLARPEKLMAQFGLPPAIAGLAALTRDLRVPDAAVLARGLAWGARSDWFALGHSRVRVYRIEARLLDTHRASVVVSRVGEILRVELPDDIVLVNEAIAAL